MDSYGMVGAYRLNRELTWDEKQHQLKQGKSQHQDSHYDTSLLKINSTFAESVDKFYQARGFTAMGGAIMMSFVAFGSVFFVFDSFDGITLFDFVLIPSVFYFGYFLFTKDAFTYTHYPIRFNRRNRTVYAWQRDGSVLKAGWDDLFFTIITPDPVWRHHSIVGHVLADDGDTVTNTFSFSYNGEHDQLKSHFEFYRRYMEESPQRAFEQSNKETIPLYCLPPLDKERETLKFGWHRATAQMNGWPLIQLLFQVVFIPESLMRWVVMQTSKIPKWPQWVEEECAIDPNDPFVHDYSTNTTNFYGGPLEDKPNTN